MNTRTFTAAAFAVVLATSVAWAESTAGSATGSSGQSGSSMSATSPGTSGSTGATGTGTSGATGASTTQPGASMGESSSGAAPGAASTSGMATSGMTAASGTSSHPAAPFTDAKTFLQEEIQEQKVVKDIYKRAQDKAENSAVKDFAKTAMKDHEQAGDKLKDLAKKQNIDEDASQGASSSHHVAQAQSLKNSLQNLEGKQFDQAFLSAIIPMHQQEISRYQAASTQATDPDLKSFAQMCLPKLQQHLQTAQSAYQQVTGTAWTGSSASGFTPTATYQGTTTGHSSTGMSGTTGSSSGTGTSGMGTGTSGSGAAGSTGSPGSTGSTGTSDPSGASPSSASPSGTTR